MIKLLETKDLTRWSQMCADVYPDTTAEQMLAEYHEGRFPNDYGYYLNDILVAFISLSVRNDYVNGCETSPVGFVEGIYIDSDYRKQGIARELVEFAKGWSKEKGCQELASDILIDNLDSLAFHEAVGFEEKERVICVSMKI